MVAANTQLLCPDKKKLNKVSFQAHMIGVDPAKVSGPLETAFQAKLSILNKEGRGQQAVFYSTPQSF